MKNEFRRSIKGKYSKWFLLVLSSAPLTLFLSSVIGVFSGHITWPRFGVIFFLSVVLFLLVFQFVKSINKKRKIAETYKLTISEEFIKREMDTYETKVIPFKDIKSIIKEKSGSIRVNGHDGIWIPSDLQDIEVVEKNLKSYFSSGTSPIPEISEEKPYETLDDFLSSLQQKFTTISLFTAVIILCSYIKLHLFYAQYDIPIHNYLEASEIIFFFTTLYKEFAISVAAFIIIYRNLAFVKMKVNVNEAKKSYIDWVSVSIPISMLWYYYIIIPDMLVFQQEGAELFTSQILLLLFCCFLAIVLSVFVLYIASLFIKERERLVTLPLTSLALFLTFILITHVENRMSYKLAVNGRPKYEVTIFLSSQEEINSSDSLIYIGSTNNYMFFRNKPKETSLVIPRSSIVKEEQKLLRKGL